MVGLYWYFVFDPKSTDLDKLAAHVDSLDEQNQKAKSQLAKGSIEQIREQARASRENLDLMRTLVPAANEVSSLIDQVSTAARRARLDVGTLEPEPVIEGEMFDTYRYRMKMNGSYHDLAQMLTNVASLNRIVSSINLQLGLQTSGPPAGPGKQMLASSFEIQTYVVRTAPRLKPGAKKPRRRWSRGGAGRIRARADAARNSNAQETGRRGTMIRRMTCALALFAAAAVPASAQMPPSIRKPIDAAKRQANRTSEQINNEQKAGNDPGTKAAPAGGVSAAMPAAAAQAAAQRGATAVKAAPASKQAADSTRKRGTVSQSGSKGTVTFYRETFAYDAAGRRDPFLSLMATGELRPMISDLTLVGVIYDESGRNSVAILVRRVGRRTVVPQESRRRPRPDEDRQDFREQHHLER